MTQTHGNGSAAAAPARAPPHLWPASEPPFEGYKAADASTYRQTNADTAIVIDCGSSRLRAGWSFDKSPRISIPPLFSKYKDRKLPRYYTYVGADVYADAGARSQARHAYEPGSNVINNWDVFEGVLDYTFHKMGISGADGGVGRPIVMTEPVANLPYARKATNEILFECYSAPKVAYGIDSLFSYRFNGGKSGLVVSSSNTATHLIPVYEHKPLLSHATRLNWGRQQSVDYLQRLLKLKYPNFPAKVTDSQYEEIVRQHCYVAQEYEPELAGFLKPDGLEGRDRVIQWPFVETIVPQKTEEELARLAEKRKEAGRRLQEQAVKMRLEKLVRKEQELEYLKELQQRLEGLTKKDAKRLLESDDFDDAGQLDKRVKEMERSIRKARNKDVGDGEEEEAPPSFPLLDIPDEQLDEDGIKQKRQQRLLKANQDARARAKAEKDAEKQRKADEERRDADRRDADLGSWVDERRHARQQVIQKMRDRSRLKADLQNRKSLASQMRMKSIANLASDSTSKKRNKRGGPAGPEDDTFGADDADWGVYRTIATGEGSDDDEEEDLNAVLKGIEAQLLQFDPDFTEQSTREAQSDWTRSLVHAYLRGPWPFDGESQAELHQMHLNVERIRVPEVVFQPSIAGLDQAGVVEIAGDILAQRIGDDATREALWADVFVTGGNTLFAGFVARLAADLRSLLPAGAALGVRAAGDACNDAWRGAAAFASSTSGPAARAWVSRAEYEEKGSEYLREHELGNVG